MQAPRIDAQKAGLLTILRAGTGMVEGMLRTLPSASAGNIGLCRHRETLGTVEYHFKLPNEMATAQSQPWWSAECRLHAQPFGCI